MTTTLLLRQHIHLRLKISMRRNTTRLRQHLTPLHLILLNPPQQRTNIIPSLPLIKKLPEHLNTSTRRLLRIPDTDDLQLITSMNNPLLNLARHHRPTTRNRKHILNRHQKRLIQITLRLRNIRIHRLHQLRDLVRSIRITLKSLQRRHMNHRHIITRKLILRQKLTSLHLHQLQQLLIINHVSLVQSNNNRRHPNLTSQQHMLPRLRHRTIRSRHHKNRPINLRRTRNHILDVISMTRHIHMRIMPIRRLILNMRHINRDPTLPLLRSLINILKRRRLRTRNPLRQHLRNRRSQRRLPMINMTHGPHIHMRLITLKLLLSHSGFLSQITIDSGIGHVDPDGRRVASTVGPLTASPRMCWPAARCVPAACSWHRSGLFTNRVPPSTGSPRSG